MSFKCNNMKCRAHITSLCLITTCLHVFCKACLSHIKKSRICLACKSLCKEGDLTIRELDISPNLNGYSPEDIIEACRNGIIFWNYQKEQELAISNAICETYESENCKLKHEIKTVKTNYELEIESLKHTIERSERSLERERQNNYDLNIQLEDKVKQHQKLIHQTERHKLMNVKLNEITHSRHQAENK